MPRVWPLTKEGPRDLRDRQREFDDQLLTMLRDAYEHPDLCQYFGHGNLRFYAAIAIAFSMGFARSKDISIASAEILQPIDEWGRLRL